MDGTSLSFAPLLPWPALAVLALAILAVAAFGLWRRARGILWRTAMLALGLLALANPVVIREQRAPLEDVAVLLTDRSPSQGIGARPQQLEEALTRLREELGQLEGVEVVETATTGDSKGGTRLFATLGATLSEIDRARLAGVLILSDGQVHDVPGELAALGVDAPLHLLLTGERDERDRRLLVEQVPNYGMVGDEQEITLRVDELPGGAGDQPVTVTLRQDGEPRQRLAVPAGVARTVPFQLTRAGQTVLEVEADAAPGEVTTLNNRQVFFINGVRDRLRVLLVSGQPYEGLRVWRNLLKADPAVDLVHFTILRPPEKQDGTPIRELALIAFPSRELFEVKLSEFDLVIFDRYSRRGLMPLAYLDNVARYVEDGGGLLEVAGPEFAHPLSLYRTPLARVLPARPSGVVYDRGFTPTLTELGQRHPVTADLVETPGDGQEQTDGRAALGPLVPPGRRRGRRLPGADERRGRAAAPGARPHRRGPGRAAALGPCLAVGARLRRRRPAGSAAAPPGALADAGAGARGGGAARRAGRRLDRDRAALAAARAGNRDRHRAVRAHDARSRSSPPSRASRARAWPPRRPASTGSRTASSRPTSRCARSARRSCPTCGRARSAWRPWSRPAAARSTGSPTAARPASAR